MAVTSYDTVNGRIRAESTGGVRTGYLPDALGSVTATVDEAGSVVNTYRYKPYGGLLAKSGADSDPQFMWVGQWGYRTDAVRPENQYVRRRTYDNQAARWMTVDPAYPQVSPFGYAFDNPPTFADPQGDIPIYVQVNNFIHKRMGYYLPCSNSLKVMDEPPPFGHWYAFATDNRDYGEIGTQRVYVWADIDSCAIGMLPSGEAETGMSTRVRKTTCEHWSQKARVILQQVYLSGHKEIGGPCWSMVGAHISGVYPFIWVNPCPTSISARVVFIVRGRNQVGVIVVGTHSQFPDTEVVVQVGGSRTVLYSYATQRGVLSLCNPFLIQPFYGAIMLHVPTDCCCTDKPCCFDECPCGGGGASYEGLLAIQPVGGIH